VMVRNSFGQQIMQFSYESADEMYCDRDLVGELGASVGSWDACSISEAAYGALEQPVNYLEESPLMNLHKLYSSVKGILFVYVPFLWFSDMGYAGSI
jgi:DNA-directed RNA polymerase IV subunit 1